MFFDLTEQLRIREKKSLRRIRSVVDGPQGSHVTIDHHEYLAFTSNDYLGLANHPDLVQAVCEGAQRFGVGAGASHMLHGHFSVHHELECALAQFVEFPAALLFSTGYMANIGVITALVGREDAIFADKLNHASLNDAALLSRAAFIRYSHLDLVTLQQRLAVSRAKRKLVISDTVFSMEGDKAPISELIALCEQYHAMLLLDDAHGFGVLGKQGRGSLFLEDHNAKHSPNVVYMATLGKAAGVFGAFVAAQMDVIETLIQSARSYIYTTAAPALLSQALLASLKLIEEEDWRRQALIRNIMQLREELKSLSWRLMASETPIQPLLIGNNEQAVQLSGALRERGILVPAIRPPTVPQGTARLRISLSAAHQPQDIECLGQTLRELAAS
ncbi:8-amino-7-oxononanoate synthase [Nitrosomonas sp. PY1]|uniref:8-amino-7-oxononanoate synthase n=1 Tax=Nitrosomonas sp. PY1 TaxID=1803906 RepID=UPI001FC81EB9|nr:8-amino-7-oxononanoate synthase [Nitrosomonas sp. PY1]GKS68843.1 8-amino-7-oxononanoate synthase [Nitrosomonas sp. PY1]